MQQLNLLFDITELERLGNTIAETLQLKPIKVEAINKFPIKYHTSYGLKTNVGLSRLVLGLIAELIEERDNN